MGSGNPSTQELGQVTECHSISSISGQDECWEQIKVFDRVKLKTEKVRRIQRSENNSAEQQFSWKNWSSWEGKKQLVSDNYLPCEAIGWKRWQD